VGSATHPWRHLLCRARRLFPFIERIFADRRSPARRSHEVSQPSGSLVIVREPSALTLIVPAPARFNCS
jgi:hypothetical protein